MMLQAVLLASLATVALGSICCAPQQWEAFKDYTIVDANTAERGLQYYSYDALNQRYAVSANYTDYVSTYKEIYDYRQGTGYRIYPLRQTCETFAVTGSFPANCIPSTAQDIGATFYGFANHLLSAISYRFNDTSDPNMNTIAVVSRRDCVPIVSTTTIDRPGNYYLYFLGYNDILPGIRDVTVFDPPSYCRKATKDAAKPLYDTLRF